MQNSLYREFGIPCYSIQITVMVPLCNNHLKHLLQFYCSSSAGNCSKPTHLRWNQFRHIWPYHHMFLASDKCKTVQSPYRGSRSGNGASLSLWKRHHCFLWKHLNTCCLILERSKFSPAPLCTSHVMWPSHFRCGRLLLYRCRVKVALHHTYIILQVTSRYQQTLDLWNAIRSKNKGPI